MNKKVFGSVFLALSLLLAACGNNEKGMYESKKKHEDAEQNHGSMDHGEMNHSGSGDVPKGLEKAKNPEFKVGSEAMINADHMEGMDGAKATISGAFDTTVYTITYTPTTGGEKVTDHKWVIHEELKDAGDQPVKQGTEVTLNADHMKGMKGAKAVIDSAEQTTVYMVDYTPTTGGKKVKNHKWVTESELSAE